jgi:hypothetical protein
LAIFRFLFQGFGSSVERKEVVMLEALRIETAAHASCYFGYSSGVPQPRHGHPDQTANLRMRYVAALDGVVGGVTRGSQDLASFARRAERL